MRFQQLQELVRRLSFLFVVILLITAPGLQARVRCLGAACPLLPADDARRQLGFLSLQFQYQEALRAAVLDAAGAANLMRPTGGVTAAQSYAVSAGAGATRTPETRMAAVVPGEGLFFDLPVAAMAVQPGLSVAANLGRLLEDLDRRAPFDASRYELHLHFVRARTGYAGFESSYGMRATGGVRSRGLDLRRTILDSGSARPAGAVTFGGLSVQVGYHGTQSHVSIDSRPRRAGFLNSGSPLAWDTQRRMNMKNHLSVMPLELRSGLRFFGRVELYGALGVARHAGSARVSTETFGALSFAAAPAALGLSPSYESSVFTDGVLAALLSGQSKLDVVRSFGRLGLVVGSRSLRVGIEWLAAPRASGVSVSLRYRFL